MSRAICRKFLVSAWTACTGSEMYVCLVSGTCAMISRYHVSYQGALTATR